MKMGGVVTGHNIRQRDLCAPFTYGAGSSALPQVTSDWSLEVSRNQYIEHDPNVGGLGRRRQSRVSEGPRNVHCQAAVETSEDAGLLQMWYPRQRFELLASDILILTVSPRSRQRALKVVVIMELLTRFVVAVLMTRETG